MRKILKTLLFFVVTSSCCKEEIEVPRKTCNVYDPIHELAWLKQMLDETPTIEVSYTLYEDGSEYIAIGAYQVDYGQVYDCSGNLICERGGYTGGTCFDYFNGKIMIISKLLKKGG